MSWIQFEVWADVDGQQELVKTTHSKKEAISLAKKIHNEGSPFVIVYEEDADGEYTEVLALSS
jgi:ATP-dependent Clp protease adapter protein ClpS